MPVEVRMVLLGAPGAGKGTQARRLAVEYGVPHISTGDMFREALEHETPLGCEVRPYLEAGRLVPDGLTTKVLERRLALPDAAKGFLLDGYPRSEPQAEALQGLLEKNACALDVALFLAVPDEELVSRLTERRFCPVCGAIYNMRFKPPRRDESCDSEAHEPTPLARRPDDLEDTVRRRLKVFHEETEPVVSFYERNGLLARVDAAMAGPDEVTERIHALLKVKGVAVAL